jgi:hypothetical protein
VVARDNSTVGLFDWLSRSRRQRASSPITWTVVREGAYVVVQADQRAPLRLPLEAVRAVRIVPLTGGQQHVQRSGRWQVSLHRDDGDLLVGEPFADWRPARELADLICARAGLPLDELSARLFSRVGTYSPPTKD